MKRSKKELVTLITIIVLIVFIVSILLFIICFTDTFKSNKERFFKYAYSFTEDEQTLQNLENYFQKQLTTPFESNGIYKTTISDNEETALSSKEQEILNNTNITFDGKVDFENSLLAENVSIAYTDETKVPLNIEITKELLAIQSDFIGKKYIATTLKDIFNINIKDILDSYKENKEKTEIKYKELKELFKKNYKNYTNAIMSSIDDSKFIKVNENESTGYKVTLNSNDLKNITVAILETLKKDQEILDKLNEIVEMLDANSTMKITPELIDRYINGINNKEDNYDVDYGYNIDFDNTESFESMSQNNNNTNIEITAFSSNNNTSQILIKMENVEVTAKKDCTDNKAQYELSIKSKEQINTNLKVSFEGLKTANNVNETYEFGYKYDDGVNVIHNLTRNVAFVDSIDVEELNEDNMINLDNMEEEQKQNLSNRINERINEVNEMQMNELGIKTDILLYELPFSMMHYGENGILARAKEAQDKLTEERQKEEQSLSQMEIKIFNYRFEEYEKDNVEGRVINNLIDTVKLNNEENKEHQIRISANVSRWDYENNQADVESHYRITFEKDDKGYINLIKIEDSYF